MYRFFLGLTACCAMGCAISAYATPITPGTYALTDAYADGSSLTGDLFLDSSGLITSGTITLNDSALNDPTFSFTGTAFGASPDNPSTDVAFFSGADGFFQLVYLDTANVDETVLLCELESACSANQGLYSELALNMDPMAIPIGSGELAPEAPEPGTLLLLATGLLGAAGVARYRWRRGRTV